MRDKSRSNRAKEDDGDDEDDDDDNNDNDAEDVNSDAGRKRRGVSGEGGSW